MLGRGFGGPWRAVRRGTQERRGRRKGIRVARKAEMGEVRQAPLVPRPRARSTPLVFAGEAVHAH